MKQNNIWEGYQEWLTGATKEELDQIVKEAEIHTRDEEEFEEIMNGSDTKLMVMTSEAPTITFYPNVVYCEECRHRPVQTEEGIFPPRLNDYTCPFIFLDPKFGNGPSNKFYCAFGER